MRLAGAACAIPADAITVAVVATTVVAAVVVVRLRYIKNIVRKIISKGI